MFTKSQIQEIAELLKAASIKDSKFTIISALEGTEYISILQGAKNRKALLSEVFAYMANKTSPAYHVALALVKEDLLSYAKLSKDELHELIVRSNHSLENTVLKFKDDILHDIDSVKHKIDISESHVITNVGRLQQLFENNLADAIAGIVDESVLKGLESMLSVISKTVSESVSDSLEGYFNEQGIITEEDIDSIMSDENFEGE